NWNQGDSVEIERYADYWGEPALLDKATFKFIADETAALAAMLAGDVDAFPNFPAPENLPQLAADPNFSVVVGSTEGETILATNNQKAPFDNVLVRRAMAHAIDRQSIIDGAMFGNGTPIGTHFAPHHPAYVDLTDTYPYDPEAAKALLAEAGFPDGFSASLKLPPPPYARDGGEIIAAQLREVGINLEITNVEWPQWLEQVFRGKDYDLTIVSHTEPMDIGIYARDDYYFQYIDEDFKGIIETLNQTVDEAARGELMADAQRKITDDAVNTFLFQLAKSGVWNAKVQGLWENSPVQANDLTAVYWEE
ncbi:MAG: ABC transporter substrate-binding protein, partial [Pseudomonadota bacterium]